MARPEEVDHGWMYGKLFTLEVNMKYLLLVLFLIGCTNPTTVERVSEGLKCTVFKDECFCILTAFSGPRVNHSVTWAPMKVCQ